MQKKNGLVASLGGFLATALVILGCGVGGYETGELSESSESSEDVLSFDEGIQLLEQIEADEASETVDKVAGRNGCPNDMTLAASRVEGASTPSTPLYCRLDACVPMGTHAVKHASICIGPPPPFQTCWTYVEWDYLATNRNASSIMCPDAIQSKFGL